MNIFPIMGPLYSDTDYQKIDLTKSHLNEYDIRDEKELKNYLANLHQKCHARFLWGGYMEHRALYQSELFSSGDQPTRDIHLGIDIWGIVYDLIYAPLDGIIHSFAYNDRDLDYGYTLILEHQLEDGPCYTLYGHLGDAYYPSWHKGKIIKAGDVIADMGPKETNGGWLPHLHFQVIKDMEGLEGDFPGVCSSSDVQKYQEICPDPQRFISPIGQ